MLSITKRELLDAGPCYSGRDAIDAILENYDYDTPIPVEKALEFDAEYTMWGISEIKDESQEEERDRILKTFAYLCVEHVYENFEERTGDRECTAEDVKLVKDAVDACKEYLLGKIDIDELCSYDGPVESLTKRIDSLDTNSYIVDAVYYLIEGLTCCNDNELEDFTDVVRSARNSMYFENDITEHKEWQKKRLHELLTHPEMLFPCKMRGKEDAEEECVQSGEEES